VQELVQDFNGDEKSLWKTWGQFIDDGAILSQYWSIQIVIRHEETALFKYMTWENSRRPVDPANN
jgi:hypothetical protein